MKAVYALGFSLVELMLSLMLSSFIILVLFSMYLSIKQNYQYYVREINDRQAILQVFNLLRDEVKHAGFSPCINLSLMDNSSGKLGLQVYSPGSGDIPQAIQKRVVPEGRVLHFTRFDFDFTTIKKQWSNKQWVTSKLIQLKKGQPILIADCHQYEIKIIDKVQKLRNQPHQLLTFNIPIINQYKDNVAVGNVYSLWVFVGKNNRGGTSLYLNDGRSDELLADVNSIDAEYITKKLVRIRIKIRKQEYSLYTGTQGRYDRLN